MADIIQQIPLSHNTIIRKTELINNYIAEKWHEILVQAKYFSIAIDETTDISDVCQLLICVRAIVGKFNITEEVLSLASIHGNANVKKFTKP